MLPVPSSSGRRDGTPVKGIFNDVAVQALVRSVGEKMPTHPSPPMSKRPSSMHHVHPGGYASFCLLQKHPLPPPNRPPALISLAQSLTVPPLFHSPFPVSLLLIVLRAPFLKLVLDLFLRPFSLPRFLSDYPSIRWEIPHLQSRPWWLRPMRSRLSVSIFDSVEER